MPPVYQIPDWLLRDNKLILPPRISLLPDLPDPPGMKPVAGWRGPSAERSASSWCGRARVSVGSGTPEAPPIAPGAARPGSAPRSEEHTSELQSRQYLVCRLLLEKKKNTS